MKMKRFTLDRRGKAVAQQIGWPRRHLGWRGAVAGLLDPFASFRKPRSYMGTLRRENLRREQATVERIELWLDA